MPATHDRHQPLKARHAYPTFALLAALSIACSETASVVGLARVEPRQVTESIAASLTRDGRFILPDSAVNPVGQLGERDAESIATQYVRQFATIKIGQWSREFGSNVDTTALHVCDRAFYAASAYEPLTASGLSEVTMRTFGPQWIVPMCGRGEVIQVVVSFSALASELAVKPSKGAALPWERAISMSFGVPSGTASLLFSPEGAAAMAFKEIGKRVSSIPELIATPMPQVPSLVRWRVGIEAPVTVRGNDSGNQRQRTSLLAGFGDTFRTAGLLDENVAGVAPPTSWTDPITKQRFVVVLKGNVPATVERITVVRP